MIGQALPSPIFYNNKTVSMGAANSLPKSRRKSVQRFAGRKRTGCDLLCAWGKKMQIFNVKSLFVVSGLLVSTVAGLAQSPTAAQQQAIRSSCVSDFRANCSGVPTGGMDALVCLEQHVSKLSPTCQTAVEAVDPGAAAPATAASKPTDDTAAKTEAAATPAAKTTTAEPSDATAAAKAPETPAKAMPAPGGMSLRQELRIAAGACAHDYRVLCPNLPVGRGNVLFCLKVHGERLSPQCHAALTKAGEVF